MKTAPQTLTLLTNDVRNDIILNKAMTQIEEFCRKRKITLIYTELADDRKFSLADINSRTIVVNLRYSNVGHFIQSFIIAIANLMIVSATHTKWSTPVNTDLRLPKPLITAFEQSDSFHYEIRTFKQRKELIYA